MCEALGSMPTTVGSWDIWVRVTWLVNGRTKSSSDPTFSKPSFIWWLHSTDLAIFPYSLPPLWAGCCFYPQKGVLEWIFPVVFEHHSLTSVIQSQLWPNLFYKDSYPTVLCTISKITNFFPYTPPPFLGSRYYNVLVNVKRVLSVSIYSPKAYSVMAGRCLFSCIHIQVKFTVSLLWKTVFLEIKCLDRLWNWKTSGLPQVFFAWKLILSWIFDFFKNLNKMIAISVSPYKMI